MPLLLKVTLCLVSLCLFGHSTVTAEQVRHHASVHPGPERVLFVGNSYLYYNDSLHNHVERMASELLPAKADAFTYKSATIGGARLRHHNIDWLLGVGNIGVEQPFELVILQGGSFEVLTDENRARFYDTVASYAAKIRAIGAEPALYMTHAYVAPHRRAEPNLTPTILATYTEAARRVGATLIPVGLAFEESYRRRPDFSLHEHFDGTHPNMRGTYLGACVVYLSLYGGSLASLQYDYFGELPEEEAAYLRGVAQTVVDGFFTAAQ